MKTFIILGAVLAALSVGLGAFGAHGLNSILTANNRIGNWETAAQYHMYHALALIVVGLLYYQFPARELVWCGWLLIVGILLFSGSLYVLSLTNITKLGAITPLGGLSFLVAWGLLIWGVWKA
jgi:uncharacterized membrane protein YgdD (TMEM256/DUF423 family)